jgi:hypothetical protein
MTRLQIDEPDSLIAARSITPQQGSDLPTPSANSLLPNP